MSRKGLIFRIVGVVFMIGLLAIGGTFAYKAGFAQGITQAPEVAEAIQQAHENGQGMPMTYGHGFGYGSPFHHGHHFGFFPFGICGSIFFLFFFFGFMKMVFFRGWGHRHGHGHWGKWEGGMSSKFDEWHKRAHSEVPSEKKDEDGK